MIEFDKLNSDLLKQWGNNTNVFLFIVDRYMSIIDHNSNFEKYSNKVDKISDLLTSTYEGEFLEQLCESIDNNVLIQSWGTKPIW